jgi:asparaginyl-tRNA synthetase
MAILKYRHLLMGEVHAWFRKNGYIEITAPILTTLPLYDDGSALSLDIHGEQAFLTQCVGFYLESAVFAFEKVYNIGPSFRGEESRSKRHLMEYWHIKAELAFANLEEGRRMIEDLIKHLLVYSYENCQEVIKPLGINFSLEGVNTPYPVISCREAVNLLNKDGYRFEFGSSLNSHAEALLSRKFDTPFWIAGIPRNIEPFPYVIDPEDPQVTRVSDLIASKGFGELLGVAEKIYHYEPLMERMEEKGKDQKAEYAWVKELRKMGCVPHIGFGMGVERFIRWMLGIEHVRDAIPFPRVFRRKIHP